MDLDKVAKSESTEGQSDTLFVLVISQDNEKNRELTRLF